MEDPGIHTLSPNRPTQPNCIPTKPSQNTVREIPHVISLLVETRPSLQHKTVEKYFAPNAQFTHPFCRTGSAQNSRYLIDRIYRWYKIMSPRISAKVTSVCFDERNQVLYVGLSQVFAIWAVPTHRSEVSLVTVLHLTKEYTHPHEGRRAIEDDDADDDDGEEEKKKKDGTVKYYITSQNDLYQTDQFVKFFMPWLWLVVPLWQLSATFVCVVLSYLFYPVTWLEEHFQEQFVRSERPPKWNDGR